MEEMGKPVVGRCGDLLMVDYGNNCTGIGRSVEAATRSAIIGGLQWLLDDLDGARLWRHEHPDEVVAAKKWIGSHRLEDVKIAYMFQPPAAGHAFSWDQVAQLHRESQ